MIEKGSLSKPLYNILKCSRAHGERQYGEEAIGTACEAIQ